MHGTNSKYTKGFFFFFFDTLQKITSQNQTLETLNTFTKYLEAQEAKAFVAVRMKAVTLQMWRCMVCCCVRALISAKRGDTCQLWFVFSSHMCSMMLLSVRMIIFVKPRLIAWVIASLIVVAWAILGHLSVVLRCPTKMFFPSLFLPIA